jgi:toxin ParE1/3/4
MRIRWTPEAFEDLKQISAFIESRRDLPTANRICRKLYDAVRLLRTHPESGRPGKFPYTRELIVSPLPYVIVYQEKSLEIVILRIWHGRQQR